MGLPTLIGGGLGLLSSLTSSRAPQQTTTSVDPQTQQYENFMRQFAQGQVGQNWGTNPAIQQMMQYLQGVQGYGNQGMGILSGQNPGALATMMAPGQNALNTIYKQEQGQGINELNKQAALAGASGNERRGIGVGSFMSQMGATRAQGLLGLLQQMYGNAGQLANMGMGATGEMGQMGQWLTNLPMQQAMSKMGILNQGMGPMGSTQTTPVQQANPFASILSGGMMGAGLGGNYTTGFGGGGLMAAPTGWQAGAQQAAANPPSIQGWAP